jgi:5-methylcytosine-specific restriction endonuclease McrA
MSQITQRDLVMEYFRQNPNRDIQHEEAVDWLTSEYQRRTDGEVFRDPDRQIRSCHQQGLLIKVAKGVYRYDPKQETHRELEEFTSKQKAEIKKRDGYKCRVCGLGKKDGVELHVDHRKPKEYGGRATIDNGQTLCGKHNYIKQTHGEFEFGKKLFLEYYASAKSSNDKKTMRFAEEVLKIYEKHKIAEHIK